MEDPSIEELRAAAARDKEVKSAAGNLLRGLSAKLLACANDPAAVRALAREITANSDGLAADIVANTPAEEPPPPAE